MRVLPNSVTPEERGGASGAARVLSLVHFRGVVKKLPWGGVVFWKCLPGHTIAYKYSIFFVKSTYSLLWSAFHLCILSGFNFMRAVYIQTF